MSTMGVRPTIICSCERHGACKERVRLGRLTLTVIDYRKEPILRSPTYVLARTLSTGTHRLTLGCRLARDNHLLCRLSPQINLAKPSRSRVDASKRENTMNDRTTLHELRNSYVTSTRTNLPDAPCRIGPQRLDSRAPSPM